MKETNNCCLHIILEVLRGLKQTKRKYTAFIIYIVKVDRVPSRQVGSIGQRGPSMVQRSWRRHVTNQSSSAKKKTSALAEQRSVQHSAWHINHTCPRRYSPREEDTGDWEAKLRRGQTKEPSASCSRGSEHLTNHLYQNIPQWYLRFCCNLYQFFQKIISFSYV